MTTPTHRRQRSFLQELARQTMLSQGLQPDFSAPALAELDHLPKPAARSGKATHDLRLLPWCSLSPAAAGALDQLTFAEAMSAGTVRLLIALADVEAVVKPASALDEQARQNVTTVDTLAQIFPLLPPPLADSATALIPAADRLAVVVEMVITADGALQDAHLYGAMVRNHAPLIDAGVGAWLENSGPRPPEIDAVAGLEASLRLQDRVAQNLPAFRHGQGALSLEISVARPQFTGETLTDLVAEKPNRAAQLLEDLLIAASGVIARYLAAKNAPALRRIIRLPRRWDRIIQLASEQGFTLPREPEVKALQQFLVAAKAATPLQFADLSLSVLKLLGAGEYSVILPGDSGSGRFGLAASAYTAGTAPHCRYPDLITQRLLKAALAGGAPPYTVEDLTKLAQHCTDQEDAARKVERQVEKTAGALLLAARGDEQFQAIVTGASPKGTWVRLRQPCLEGRLVAGFEGLEVGRRLRVRLVHTDVALGQIDFQAVTRRSERAAGALALPA